MTFITRGRFAFCDVYRSTEEENGEKRAYKRKRGADIRDCLGIRNRKQQGKSDRLGKELSEGANDASQVYSVLKKANGSDAPCSG